MPLHQRIRRAKLQGEQLDICFPRRGRPSPYRRLERAGQMRLGLHGHVSLAPAPVAIAEPETIDEALEYLFPIRPLTEDELAAEFNRLFPVM